MSEKYGVIFLDKAEIIIQVFDKVDKDVFVKVYDKQYDMETFSTKKTTDISEIVEVIAQTALARQAINVVEWRICARDIAESIVSQISYITNIKAEILTLSREQNLICSGIVSELR